jgi:hypothetical protein
MTDEKDAKPWYRSLASWGGVLQLALTLAIAVALYLGVDVEALLRHGLAAAGIAAAVMQVIGNIARRQPIDMEQVLPRVKSHTVGRALSHAVAVKKRVLP